MSTTLSYRTAILRVQELLLQVDGIERCYSAASSEPGEAFPEGAPETHPGEAAAIIYPPEEEGYLLTNPHHSRRYRLPVEISLPISPMGVSMPDLLDLFDQVIDLLAANVTLGARIEHCLYAGDMRMEMRTWAGESPTHMSILFGLNIKEAANITTVGIGS